jgi:hypothetical protein
MKFTNYSFTQVADENVSRIFERRMLRIIYGPIKENGVWKFGLTVNFISHIMNRIKSMAVEMSGTPF